MSSFRTSKKSSKTFTRSTKTWKKALQPYNAMINAGAIAIVSMIKKETRDAGVDALVEKMAGAAGRPLRIDQSVYASEDATGNRHRAIAYLNRSSWIAFRVGFQVFKARAGVVDNHPLTSLEKTSG